MVISTTLDLLYLILAIGLGIFFISLSFFVWKWIEFMKKVNSITEKADEITDSINTYFKLPATAFYYVSEWMKKNKEKENS